MYVFQYAAAFSSRLYVRRFVLGMLLNGHEFLIWIGDRNMPTACSGLLRRWIHLDGRGAAWLWIYSREKYMPLIRVEEEADYEFYLTYMLLRLRRFSSIAIICRT